MKRGIDAVEYMLNEGLPYISGPQFLADHVLQGKHVLGGRVLTENNYDNHACLGT